MKPVSGDRSGHDRSAMFVSRQLFLLGGDHDDSIENRLLGSELWNLSESLRDTISKAEPLAAVIRIWSVIMS